MMLTIYGELDQDQIGNISQVDLAIVACGYESRARAFAEAYDFSGAKRIALTFEEGRVLAFEENSQVLHEKGFSLVNLADEQVRDWLSEMVSHLDLPPAAPEVRVFVDISSQSRTRLASIIEALAHAGNERVVRAYFGYSLAAYVAPPKGRAPNVHIGPVSPYFAGWTVDPDLPLSLVIGLGYEPDRALGAVEYLEPSTMWALVPQSSVRQYDRSLRSANRPLLRQVGSSRLLEYDVQDPNATFAVLISLVAHLSRHSSVLLLPSGPKVLVLLSLLIGCLRRDVAVWRVSAGVEEPPVDRQASGHRLVIACVFRPAEVVDPAMETPAEAVASSRWVPLT